MENDLHRMVEGHEAVIGWFGEWPSFHDAEVLSLRLNRSATSSLEVLTWRTRSETNDAGHYVRDKFAVITFSLESISSLELTEFNHQNVIGELTLEKVEGKIRLHLYPCYGLNGYLEAHSVRVEIRPTEEIK